ncbi:MAG: serine hydrolase domain-containing protein [Bacteroidota bacterium]|nr:serine hydrolase domain-containing protein [Bacteroidota bacterium]
MNTKRYFIIVLLAACNTVFAQEDTVVSSLLRDVPVWMARHHVPCTSIGLIEGGHIKWLKIFGVLQQGRPAPTNTLFNIASQTKPVTAMLTMKLVQAGLWNLDEPLSHYWVDPDIAGNPWLNELTTRIVLSHQTGFPNWRTDNGGSALRFNFEPGTKFGYSGEGFEYLRRALENKFHQPLNTLMETWLFKPLHMNDTRYWTADLDTNRFAMWHDGKGNRYNISIQTPVSAADDLITTVEDYCRLGIYSMYGLGLSDSLFADMTRPQVKVKKNYYRCLGWGLVEGLPDKEYALEHGGSDIGVRTMAVFLPRSKRAVVVMTNADNGIFVTDQVITRALPEGAQILKTMNAGSVPHNRITISDDLIKGYTGIYAQSNGKLMKVEREGNAIKVSGDGLPTAVLYPESANRFFLEGYDVQIGFADKDSLIVYENGKRIMKLLRQSK